MTKNNNKSDKEIRDLFKKFSSTKKGLSDKDAKDRLVIYGPNEIEKKKENRVLKILFRQFKSIIVWVLFFAAFISYYIGEIHSFWTITFIIWFVIFLGFIQEYKAEKAMEELKNMLNPITKVLRNNRVKKIPIKEVVPGDIILLESGDIVPADSVVFEAKMLNVDESILTGESISVEKSVGDTIFAGSKVVFGKCKALVIATGPNTELGKIAKLIQEDEEKTPLQIRMNQLTKVLLLFSLGISILTFIIGLSKGAPKIELLIVILSLIVASIPEGLPLTLTLTLAYGMHKMAKHKAIIRKMSAVETIGNVSVICTDKTGTITKNEMTVKKIYVYNKIFDVTEIGYEPRGEIKYKGKKTNLEKEPDLEMLFKASILCNNSYLENIKGIWKIIGDPTEGSLIVAALKANLKKEEIEKKYPRIEEIIFTSERKMMTTIHEYNGKKIAFVKGAPEIILNKSKFIRKNGKVVKLDEKTKEKIIKINKSFASDAYRVLAIAYKDKIKSIKSNVEKDLIFIGLVGIMDPPRKEVKNAVKSCKKAGIKIVMITGDNEETAKSVAKMIGLYEKKPELNNIKNKKLKKMIKDGILLGEDLEKLEDKEFDSIVDEILIYARIKPEQKLRIVEALKRKGHIVAMTGDGINDAPALKRADVGISMGIKGTDVAKEASVMILQDDNFATIVEAIKQGRTIYENIKKFTFYLISRNYCEVFLTLLAISFFGFELLPILALPILFINLIGEEFPALALSFDPPRKDIMSKQFKRANKFITKKDIILLLGLALIMTLVSFTIFAYSNPIENIKKARTVTFVTLIGMVIFNIFNFRSLDNSIFKTGLMLNRLLFIGISITLILTIIIIYVPYFQTIFGFTSIGIEDWLLALLASFITMIYAELLKILLKNKTF